MLERDGKNSDAIRQIMSKFPMNYATLFTIFYTIVFLWFAKSFFVAIFSQPEKVLFFRFIPFALAILVLCYLVAFNISDFSLPNILKIFLPLMLIGIVANFIFNSATKAYFLGNGYSNCSSKLPNGKAYGNKYDLGEKIGDNMWVILMKNGCP